MDNAAAFIDGFNLYHGMNSCGLRSYLWVDLWTLARSAIPASAHLNEVNYFTAPSKDPESNARQGDFLGAQRELHPDINIVDGFFRADTKHCKGCPPGHEKWVEKRSDVNMAVEAVKGALEGDAPRFDLALFVTADADQVTTIETLREANVRVIVAFPPGRYSDHLRDVANQSFKLGRKHIVGAQMQPTVTLTNKNNYTVHRPDAWGAIPDQWPDVEALARD